MEAIASGLAAIATCNKKLVRRALKVCKLTRSHPSVLHLLGPKRANIRRSLRMFSRRALFSTDDLLKYQAVETWSCMVTSIPAPGRASGFHPCSWKGRVGWNVQEKNLPGFHVFHVPLSKLCG